MEQVVHMGVAQSILDCDIVNPEGIASYGRIDSSIKRGAGSTAPGDSEASIHEDCVVGRWFKSRLAEEDLREAQCGLLNEKKTAIT